MSVRVPSAPRSIVVLHGPNVVLPVDTERWSAVRRRAPPPTSSSPLASGASILALCPKAFVQVRCPCAKAIFCSVSPLRLASAFFALPVRQASSAFSTASIGPSIVTESPWTVAFDGVRPESVTCASSAWAVSCGTPSSANPTFTSSTSPTPMST